MSTEQMYTFFLAQHHSQVKSRITVHILQYKTKKHDDSAVYVAIETGQIPSVKSTSQRISLNFIYFHTFLSNFIIFDNLRFGLLFK